VNFIDLKSGLVFAASLGVLIGAAYPKVLSAVRARGGAPKSKGTNPELHTIPVDSARANEIASDSPYFPPIYSIVYDSQGKTVRTEIQTARFNQPNDPTILARLTKDQMKFLAEHYRNPAAQK